MQGRPAQRWIGCGFWMLSGALGACGSPQATPQSAGEAEFPSPGTGSVHEGEEEGEALSPSAGNSAAAGASGDKSKKEPPAASELAAAEEAKAEAVPAMREVVYTVTPQGLTIEVEGARFKPRATVTKQPGGGFGIDLVVEAEAKDERNHTLLSPTLGPLAIAARIRDKADKEVAHYADRRVGDGQELLLPGNPLVLKRSWPSGEVKGPLWWGQKVHLDVGLWGLGTDADAGRPLKKLFVVDMVGGHKPQAIISPPDIK
jgi:hypothetical protein